MNLVQYAGLPTHEFDIELDHHTSEEELINQINEIQKDINKYTKIRNESQIQIGDMIRELELINCGLILELKELNIELQELHDRLEDKYGPMDNSDSKQKSEDQPSESEQDQQSVKERSNFVKNRMKELYRKIAQKTHPDVAKNKEYIDLFYQAKSAFELGNYDLLKTIWSCIKNGKRAIDELKLKLDNKKNELNQVVNQVVTITNSNEFRMSLDWMNPLFKKNVNDFYKQIITTQIDAIKQQLNHARNLNL